MSEIAKLSPECIWRNFDALTQVPRPSGHLEKVQEFLLQFAKEAGVEGFKDAAGNIVMRKPASAGMEGRKGVILQAHMDMVPQKSKDSKHNFETDPIETWIDGDWVKARNTTLGSDDGIGVAAIMAVMEDKTLKHGPVEALITADEETGMYGANDLPCGELNGDILLNLDSETWGKFVIGSAGGLDVTATMEFKEETVPAGLTAIKLQLKGLRGGHSGLEIHEGRANANKLMARVVRQAIAEEGARLATWHGGNMRNAIPFECETVVLVEPAKAEAIAKLAEEFKATFEAEYHGIESGIQLTATATEQPAGVMPVEIQDNVVSAIYACHNGVIRFIPSYPEVVETSSNLAIIDIEGGKASVQILARSSRESMKEYVAYTLQSAFNMAGMKVEFSGGYTGWDPNPDSEILNLMKKLYKEQTGEEAVVQADHAGLECSVILGKYPHLDVVSLGPTLRSPHTTSERCLISSIAPFWQLLKKALEEIPAK